LYATIKSSAVFGQPVAGQESTNQYTAIFLSLIVFYAASLIGLHWFMLDVYGSDFLERNWMAADVTPSKGLFAFLAVLIVAHFAALQRRLASDFFLTILAIFPVIPMIALFSNRGAAPDFVAMVIACYVLIWILFRIPIPDFRRRDFGLITENNFTLLSLTLILLSISLSIYSGNLEHVNFDFSEVYEFRYDADSSRFVFVNYTIPNIIGLFLPLSIAIFLKQKRYLFVGLMVILNIGLFGLTSHKSYFFVPIFVILFYTILVNREKTFLVILSMALLMLLATGLHLLSSGYDIIPTLTVRRMFFVPAYANYLYNDFFSVSPKMLWSDSKLSLGLVDNPYGYTAPRVILNYYNFGSMSFQYAGNSNTGFLGAGYGHGGFAGMIFYSFVVAGLLRVANGIAEKLGYVTTCAGLTHLFIAVLFSSSDTLSSFLSYGSLLMVIFAVLLKKSDKLV
jgi:hypothetical protein